MFCRTVGTGRSENQSRRLWWLLRLQLLATQLCWSSVASATCGVAADDLDGFGASMEPAAGVGGCLQSAV